MFYEFYFSSFLISSYVLLFFMCSATHSTNTLAVRTYLAIAIFRLLDKYSTTIYLATIIYYLKLIS